MTDLAAAPSPSSPFDVQGPGPSRRRVLVGGGVVVAAAALTAACGSSSSSSPAAGAGTPPPPAGTSPSSGGGGGTTVATSDVPVGGGEVLTAQQVVITQPTAGTFKAFTAVCTHRGCLVASVADGLIACPCHGSRYSILDGSVKAGPAPSPLAPVPITVSGTTITIA